MTGVDNLYAGKRDGDFVFDEAVAAVFPDMIRRSLPGYETLIDLQGIVAGHYLHDGSTLYDLGCSLGAAIVSVHSRADKTVRYIGVDNSAAMLAQCKRNLAARAADARVELLHADVREVEIADADLVLLNFTLQFINRADRLALLRRIYDGLKNGTALILSEKIAAADADENALQQALHARFKTANGYSEMEIAQKRAALEKVMLPDNIAAHRRRLRAAGFRTISEWYRAFNFVSFIAIK